MVIEKKARIIMFIKKYVSDFYFNEILSKYELNYLKSLKEENFLKIYRLFLENKFYFIEDIILKYLEIFDNDYEEVKSRLNILKESLGSNYQYVIGRDMRYLNYLTTEE